MFRVLLTLSFLGLLYSQNEEYKFGPHLCRIAEDPLIDHQHGFHLDAIIDLFIQDTDVNGNGLIDTEEIRDILLAKWSVGAMSVNKTTFVKLIHENYFEDEAVAGVFFDCLDAMEPKGILNEADFITTLMTSGFMLDAQVDLNEFRLFLHHYHPHGCVTSKCNGQN